MSPGANAAARRWSMLTQSGVVAGISRRLMRGVGTRDDRPRVRVGGRFAGEVSRVEFRDGGVEVVGVEHDERRDPLVGVDLDDAEHIVRNASGRSSPRENRARLRTRRSPRVAMTSDVAFVIAELGDRPQSLAISASRPCRMPAFTTRRRSSVEMSSASISAMASQSRAAKCAREALGHLACRVFQPRCRPAELIEPRDRGVEVCLVEDLAAVDQVACRPSEG